MNIPNALDAAERIVRLLKAPEPGVVKWQLMLATADVDLEKALTEMPELAVGQNVFPQGRWTDPEEPKEAA